MNDGYDGIFMTVERVREDLDEEEDWQIKQRTDAPFGKVVLKQARAKERRQGLRIDHR